MPIISKTMEQLVEQVVHSIVSTVRDQLQSTLTSVIADGMDAGLEPLEIAQKALEKVNFTAISTTTTSSPSQHSCNGVSPKTRPAKTSSSSSKSSASKVPVLTDVNGRELVCEAIKTDNSPCQHGAKKSFNGKNYCLLHYRSAEKKSTPKEAKKPAASGRNTRKATPAQSSVQSVLEITDDLNDLDNEL
jgi:hypothetical protein